MPEPGLVAAAGILDGGAVQTIAVGDLEAVTAPARAGGVRVVDLEARLLQRLDEVALDLSYHLVYGAAVAEAYARF